MGACVSLRGVVRCYLFLFFNGHGLLPHCLSLGDLQGVWLEFVWVVCGPAGRGAAGQGRKVFFAFLLTCRLTF